MNNISKKILSVFFLGFLTFVFIPQTTSADQLPDRPGEICSNGIDDDSDTYVDGADKECYVLLEPLPGMTAVNTNQGLASYLRLVFRLAIGIAGVIAVVKIVLAGIEHMTSESPFSKSKAKDKLLNSILGILLLLGSVVILNTINPELLNISLNLAPITGSVTEEDKPSPVTSGGKVCNGLYTVGANWATESGLPIATYSDGSRITTNHPEKNDCATVGEKNCTSLRGLNPIILDTIKTKCPNCEVVVTGGTECWAHLTHKPNTPIVDLRTTPTLNQYITGTTTEFPNNGCVYTRDGVKYLAEMAGQFATTTATHWHVSTTSTKEGC